MIPKVTMHPDESLCCVLVHTKFSEFSYWNYKIACETLGAKTPSAPLGLITAAALAPKHWQYRLMDLNTGDFDQAMWDWADLVLVGGMLPQQKEMLRIIEMAKAQGKYVICGGADPSSQPEIYAAADALVLDEGEITIPAWLESWKNGQPCGVFRSSVKPDVTKTPIPMYELLKFSDYYQIGVQYSRGCPFNCEFCDIIELFGRVPRAKTPEQILGELKRLHDLGYRGPIDLVDDNFIGNKRKVKNELLPALIEWSKKHRHPFFFNTEASMNMADDIKLLELMSQADFRYIFMGIESPDPEILMKTQKSQNTMRPIVDRVNRLYEYGMMVTGGFIMGFDGEKNGTDIAMIKCIEEANVCMAMVGLLVALPNTQLTRRLKKEGRLINFKGELVSDTETVSGYMENSLIEVIDQTTAGLNFVTQRDRKQILSEYARVVEKVYDPKVYMDRVYRMAKKIKPKPKHLPSLKELGRQLRALYRVCVLFTKRPNSRRYYWRNFWRGILLGPLKFDAMMKNVGIYLHFENQTKYVLETVKKQIEQADRVGQERAVGELQRNIIEATNLLALHSHHLLPKAEAGKALFG